MKIKFKVKKSIRFGGWSLSPNENMECELPQLISGPSAVSDLLKRYPDVIEVEDTEVAEGQGEETPDEEPKIDGVVEETPEVPETEPETPVEDKDEVPEETETESNEDPVEEPKDEVPEKIETEGEEPKTEESEEK